MEELDSVQINFEAEGLFVLNVALAIVMFGVALGIRIDDFKNLFRKPKLLLLGVACQFVLLPFATFLLILLLEPQPSIALGMIMVAACPGGNISNFMTQLAHGNSALSVSLTAIATCLALIMTPFNFQLYGHLYEPTAHILKTVALDPLALVKLVVLILGVPLVLGMVVRHHYPNRSRNLSRLLKPLSIMVFIGMVIIAFVNNLDIFFGYVHHVIGIGVLHNLMAIGIGFGVARLFKLSLPNQKALTIETGIQNSGLGLLLIFTFFNGLGGMALMAAFWGIWHIISGLVLATLWSRQQRTTSIA